MNELESNGDLSRQSVKVASGSIEELVGDRHHARLSRVLDFQASSLAKADPLEANLGSINSGLMRVALWLDEAIEEAMDSGPRTVDRLQRMLPAIETHLRVTRQVDRFAQLELRNAEARKPKVGEPTPAEADQPFGLDTGESEDSEV